MAIIMIFAVVAGVAAANKKTQPYKLTGIVMNPDKKPVDFSTVVLIAPDNRQFSTMADSVGTFSLEAPKGEYTLVVQCLGYESIEKPYKVEEDRMETLILKPSAYALKEVVVNAKSIERQADRFIMTIQPLAGKDGADLLKDAPGVWVGDDKISINGASGSKVFVDNREIKLTGEPLINYLRSLRSENIRRIEVVPVAGAEFDANSQGGIIIISLRRRESDGMQGSLVMDANFGNSFAKYNPSASITARTGKFVYTLAASGNFTPQERINSTTDRLYFDNSTDFNSLSNDKSNTKYYTMRGSGIYEIDTMNSVGAELEYIDNRPKVNTLSSTIIKNGGITTSDGVYSQHNNYRLFSSTLNFIHKMDAQGSLLKFIADYNQKRNENNNHYNIRQNYKYDNIDYSTDTTYRNRTKADYDILSGEISMVRYLQKWLSFRTGAKYTHTYMNSKSHYEGFSKPDAWTVNDKYGYKINYHENIAGAYFTATANLPKWSFTVGMRGEYTNTSDKNYNIKSSYFDLFPNVNVSYAFDIRRKYMLIGQYGRSIERPPFYMLNPSRIQTSDYTYMIGNPSLKPMYIDRIGATFVYNYRYTLSVGVNLQHDLFREFNKTDAENPQVSYVTYENHHRENHWYVSANAPLDLTNWLTLNMNWTGVKQDIKMYKDSKIQTHYLSFTNVTSIFKMPRDFSAEVQFSGFNRLYTGNCELGPRNTLNVTLRKKLCNNRFLILAGVYNIFDQGFTYAANMDNYRQESASHIGSSGRYFKVALTWNFNSGKKLGKNIIEKVSDSERSRLNDKN